MPIYDVIIIGGGIVGTSIARELSRYKLNIALIEKEVELAFGVSKSNSGIIHPGTQNPPSSLKGRLCVQGNILTRKIARELGVDFKETGELIVAFSEEEVARLEAIKKDAVLLGVPNLKIVGRSWLKTNEPNLNSEAIAALYAPTAGIISPYRLVYALSENAAKNGVDIHTLTEVSRLTPAGACFEVASSKGIFKARYIINAAGLFADAISQMAGINDFKIMPRKGEEFILDKKKELLTRHLLFPLPSKTSKGILVIKTADGNPMIGPTAEQTQDKEDLSTSDEGFKKVLDSAKRLIPSVSATDIIAYFAGLRPVAFRLRSGLPSVAVDDFIIRHEDKAPGFINVAGIQSPGLTAAPAIALMVAGILKEQGLAFKKRLLFHGRRQKCVHLSDLALPEARKLIKKDASYGDIVCRCEMVSAKEVKDAIKRGAVTMDGIKFRTRAQAGRCHGSFCTTRIMKILAEEKNIALTAVTKKGSGSGIVLMDRGESEGA